MPTEKFNLDVRSSPRIAMNIHEQLVDAAKIRTIRAGTKYSPSSVFLEDLTKKSGDYATNIRR